MSQFSPIDARTLSVPRTPKDGPWGPNPGCYANLPAEIYHASKGVSRSLLVLTAKSPHHVLHRSAFKGTPATRSGALLHAMTWEPDSWQDQYVLLGSHPISGNAKPEHPRSRETLRGIVEGYAAHGKIALRDEDLDGTGDELLDASMLIRQSAAWQDIGAEYMVPEASWYWRSELFGLERARTDGAGWTSTQALICDLKSCQDGAAKRRAVERQIFNDHLDVQAEMYSEGAAEVIGCRKSEVLFTWLYYEKGSGATALYSATPSILKTGRAKLTIMRERLAAAMKANAWPAYNGGQMAEIEAPDWALDLIDQGNAEALLN